MAYIVEIKNSQTGLEEVLYRHEMSLDKTDDIFEVISFEMFELCNTDIPEYCLNHYTLSPEVKELTKRIVGQCGGDELSKSEQDNYVHGLISDISKCTGKNIKYAIWLATYDAVKELYEGDEEGGIDSYKTSNVILSDLDYDGKLFAYTEEPIPVECDV